MDLAEELHREAPRCYWVLWDPGVGETALSISLAGESYVLQESIVIAALCIGGKHVEKLCPCRNLVLEKLCTVSIECWGMLALQEPGQLDTLKVGRETPFLSRVPSALSTDKTVHRASKQRRNIFRAYLHYHTRVDRE